MPASAFGILALHLVVGTNSTAVVASSEMQGVVPPSLVDCLVHVDDVSPPRLDARCFYEQLLERYRRIAHYRDHARVVQVTRRAGDEPRAVATRVSCSIEGDDVVVESAGERLRREVLPKMPLRRPAAAEETARSRDLWLAPHMALRGADPDGRDLRSGVGEGFTAANANLVQVGDEAMVHLELRSGEGTSEADDARIDLWVDVDSLLVERIEGSQPLPDGGEFRTEVEIDSIECEDRPSLQLPE